jgi:hypothetical protein
MSDNRRVYRTIRIAIRQLIETFFSDQKSRGFNIHKSHLSDTVRLTI